MEDIPSLPFGSSLAGMGRVVRTNSRLSKAPPSLGAFESFVASGGASLRASCSFACSSFLCGSLGRGGSLERASLLGLTTLEDGSSRESEGPKVRMVRGSICFLAS